MAGGSTHSATRTSPRSEVEVVVDVQLARFERSVLGEGHPEPTCHLHRSQSHLLKVSWKVLNEDGGARSRLSQAADSAG